MGLLDRFFRPSAPSSVPAPRVDSAYVLARHEYQRGTLVFLDVGVFGEKHPTVFNTGIYFSVLHESWATSYQEAQTLAEGWIRDHIPGVPRYAGRWAR